MANTMIIFKREFCGYFTTPIAGVFLVIFLFLSSALTFYWGGFFERGQADLLPFFTLLPWLLLLLIPAFGMRLWAEEFSSGTIELLTSLPLVTRDMVLGKFFAAWTFTALALMLTFPLWITVNFLGNPDNGVIFSSYIGAFLMAGGLLSISACLSAVSKNQVMAFILSVVTCLIFMLSGFPWILDFFKSWAPSMVIEMVSHLSLFHHSQQINKGILDVRDVIYFISFISLWLFANIICLEHKKA